MSNKVKLRMVFGTAFLPMLADLTEALRNMASASDKVLQAATPQELDAAWNELFLNTKAARELLQRPKDQIVEAILRGLKVNAWGLTTTQAAVKVQALTGLALVVATPKQYNDAFLYSLALAAEVDPGSIDLSDKQAEVAFRLAALWKTEDQGVSPPLMVTWSLKRTRRTQARRTTHPWRGKRQSSLCPMISTKF